VENIEMFKWRKEVERLNAVAQSKIVFRIIKEFCSKCNFKNVKYTGSPDVDILYIYYQVKDTEDEKILLDLLYKYDFEFSSSIHNAMYYMLVKKTEFSDLFFSQVFGITNESLSPKMWPGVIDFINDGSYYEVKTNLGQIKVYKANEIISSPIFDKMLMNQCYERTYEFLKENKDYNAVISLMPDFFEGEHYHAYLEKNGHILDIASNAYYEDQKSIDTIFCGEELARLSYEEVEDEYLKLKRIYPNLSERSKLHSLAVHYDYNKNR